jgi:type I restriction enzyme S subunit
LIFLSLDYCIEFGIWFKEFSGEWEQKKLGDVSDVRDGTHDSPKYHTKGKMLITSKNLLDNNKIDFSNITYISEIDFKKINKRSRVDIGDIVFAMIGTIGNPVMLKEDGFAIKNVALIKEKTFPNIFLIQLLNSEAVILQFRILSSGNTQKFIALGNIRNLQIRIPLAPKEQQKIANTLSTLDNLIEAQDQKITQLKQHKKGLMQQLFVRALIHVHDY